MSRDRVLFYLLLMSFVLAGGSWLHAETEARKKARYYYAAGVREQASGNNPQAYEYFRKAYDSDPSYEEAASAFGSRRLYILLDTLQKPDQLEYSLSLMRPYVDKYPGDINESLNYGFVAGQLDHTDDAVEVLERAYALNPRAGDILLQLSDVYARAYKLRDAIDALVRYERQEGLSAPVTMRKISYLLAENDTVAAVAEASRLIAADPKDVSYLILKGNLFDIIERPDSALSYYRKAENLDPESGAAKISLAGYYKNQGDSVMYDNKIYEVLLTEDFGVEQKVELLADYLETLFRDSHDTSRGDYLFSVLRTQYPHDARVLDLAARYSAAKQNFEEAEEEISYAIDRDPSNRIYWGQLMTYQAAGDNPERALDTYKKALEHIEADETFNIAYASIAQMVKHYDEAIDIYRGMILDIDPGLKIDSTLTLRDVRKDISMRDLDMLSSLLTMLGDTYHSKGDTLASYNAYENAITFNSSNNMAKNNYAYFMSLDGNNLDKAKQLSKEALSGEDAENPTYLDTYAWISYLLGDLDTASEYQQRAVEAMKNKSLPSPEIYDHLGDIMKALDRDEEAVAAWEEALRLLELRKETDDPSYEIIKEKLNQTE